MDGDLAGLRKSIDSVPWHCLAHAYDIAVDAPPQLTAFFDAQTAEDQALANAVDWMWMSVLHQGSIYSATVPCVSILVDLVDLYPEHPAAEEVVLFVDAIADAFSFGRPVPQADDSASERQPLATGDSPLFEAWVSPDAAPPKKGVKRFFKTKEDRSRYSAASHVRWPLLVTLLERSLPLLTRGLQSSSSDMRSASLGALCRIASHVSELADLVPMADLHSVIGSDEFDPGCWVSAVMVGEGHLAELIEHPDRRVRLGAALNPNCPDENRAVEELVGAMNDVEWLEASFPNGAPTLDGGLRFSVLERVLNLVPAETAEPHVVSGICNQLAKRAEKYTVDREWGPVVKWAFEDRWVARPILLPAPAPLPKEFSHAQRAVLETLIEIDGLWDPKFGNASLTFSCVQLPFDRNELAQLLG